MMIRWVGLACGLGALLLPSTARADIPFFTFQLEQAEKNVEIFARTSGAEFFSVPCEFEIKRRRGEDGEWHTLYEGDLGVAYVDCVQECHPDGTGGEYCYDRCYDQCGTFADLCPAPGEYDYKLVNKRMPSPYESGYHTEEHTRSITVNAAEGDCEPPADAVASVRFEEPGCGCTARADAALPNLLLLALLFGVGGFLSVRHRRRD